MGRSKTSGIFRGKDGTWSIDKVHRSGRFQRGGFEDYGTAESWLIAEVARRDSLEGSPGSIPTFDQAAAHYLTEHEHKLSIDTDIYLLEPLMPYVGHLPIDQVHDGTLKPFVKFRKKQGRKAKTINLALSLVRRILNLCARSWRGEDGKPWLKAAPPLLTFVSQDDQREPMQLSWDQQRAFMPELPAHLDRMALFDLNTGARDSVVCNLRWPWEVRLEELGFSVFVVPKQYVKGRKRDRVLVCNSVAQRVIESVRGMHPEFVFAYSAIKKAGKEPKYKPIATMDNTGWQGARIRGGVEGFRVHDMRHTVGMRLREAGVSEETRADILWHVRKGMPQHYAVAQVIEIRAALELITDERHAQNVSLATLVQKSRVPLKVPSTTLERKTA